MSTSTPPSTEPGRTTATPHDLYARYVFRDPARAAEAVAAALGPEVASLVDWTSLRLEPTALIDDALDNFLPDLRFTADLQGLEIRIELLFEHQSETDRLMPVRFFCETGALWADARREKRPVPFVLNVVLYNGLEPWDGPMELWRAIDGGSQLRAKAPHLLPTLPYVVEDLAVLTEEEIDRQFSSPAVRLALYALKNARRGEGVRTLRLPPEVAALIPPDVFKETVRYVCQVDRSARLEDVREAVRATEVPAVQESAMTIAEQLLTQGRAEGRVEGRVEGERLGQAKLLMGLMRRRGFQVTDEQRQLIEACSDQDQLEKWAEAVGGASSAADVLDPPTRH
jgi:hypothetical protein